MTSNKYDFANQVVLVTGASSGIGRAIAQAFLDNQAKVAVVGRRLKGLQSTLAGYPEANTLALCLDLSIPENAAIAIQKTLAYFGRLDVLISNAGIYAGGPLQEMSRTAWEKMRLVNVDAFFYLAKAAYPALKQTKGKIVATSSVSGSFGDWGQAAYNATKHAINGFVKSLALDWGKDGIRVNAVAPAFTKTEMTANIGRNAEELKPFIKRIALGRPGHPTDIAPAVLFLASADAGYITGSILNVDGGTSASSGQPHLE